MVKARALASTSHTVSGGFWRLRDIEDGHSESASLDLSLSFRWVEG
jgi:hypothetical protein